ncbi:MAG: sulfate ABC transporter substrate-binding protein [Chloroflexota bacterium]
MLSNRRSTRLLVLLSLLAVFAVVSATASHAAAADVTLTLGAYSVPSEAYGEIIPLFAKYWLDKTGQKVVVKESYGGSGSQSRAIIGGFEADVAALSLEPDMTRIVKANLITHDWKKNDYKGFVTDSVVVLAVRKDNPKAIKDWKDLTQSGLEIITPDPASSGGAKWNILGAYGAAKRGYVDGYAKTDEAGLKFAGDVFKNVTVMDKDGRESFLNFERGVGDVAITYESEVFGGQKAGEDSQIVYPTSTILIETPVAVIDAYVDKHGTREVAEAFVNFLWSTDAQKVFAKYGFRPVDPTLLKDPEIIKQFPAMKDQFTIDEFGGWDKADPAIFGKDGMFTKLLTEIKGQ